MSCRGSRPKIASDNSSVPALSALRVWISAFMTLAPSSALRRRRIALRHAELARHRHTVRKLPLDRVPEMHPAALGARDRAPHHDQPALDIGADHFDVLRRHLLVAELAGHLLAGKGPPRRLALAGRAMRAMADRNAVAGPQAGEVPALHRALIALADGDAGDIDELALDEVIGGDLRPHRNQVLRADPELGELALRLDLGNREAAALGPAQP